MRQYEDSDGSVITDDESDLDTERPSVIVPTLVASARGVDVTDVDHLSEAVDPEALDAVASTPGVEVTFRYEGYLVGVDDETVRMELPES
jgi:hypothetical protein